jgi:ribokinase
MRGLSPAHPSEMTGRPGRSQFGDASNPFLTVVGSVNLDLVARCERLPCPGETVTDATFARHPGGKGANQAVAAARLGADVAFVGRVGADELADESLAGLQEAGVELSLGRGGATGVALILVDEQGENQIVVAPGANSELGDVEVAGAVLCQLEIPVAAVESAAGRAERFFLNAAPARLIPAALVRAAELVVVNRYELEALPETPRLTALTLGEDGAVLLEGGNEVARAGPPRVRAVDGTAAGDAFTACLVVSVLEERDPEEALRRACAAGAIAASRPGAQPSLPTAVEVDEILNA